MQRLGCTCYAVAAAISAAALACGDGWNVPGGEARMRPRPEYEAPRYRGAGKPEGKAALITGGDSGIGRAVAVLYAREGADVAIVHLAEEQEDVEETRRAVEAEGKRCLLLPGDVTDPKFCARAVREVGRLDALVNNAAYQQHVERIADLVVDKPAEKAARHGIDTPMKRPAQPEEIAPPFVFLASNADSGYVTGEILSLLGGETTAA